MELNHRASVAEAATSQELTIMSTSNVPRKEGVYDAPNLSGLAPGDDVRTVLLNKVSWGAVLAGVVVSLVAHLILNMIGIGVGASTVDVAAADNPAASTFSMGAAIWWTVSGIIAAFVGGYTAGRLSGKPKNTTAGWHGLTTWALTTLLIFWLLSSAVGGILGGIYNTVSGAIGSVGSAAGTAAQSAAPSLANVTDPFSQIEQSVRSSTGGNDPQALRDSAVAAVRAAMTGDQAQAQDARERAAQAISRAQGIPVEDARSTRLNSSHMSISYAVFCLKKKKNKSSTPTPRTPSAVDLSGICPTGASCSMRALITSMT